MKRPQIVMRTKYSLWFYYFVFALYVYFQDDKFSIGHNKCFRKKLFSEHLLQAMLHLIDPAKNVKKEVKSVNNIFSLTTVLITNYEYRIGN